MKLSKCCGAGVIDDIDSFSEPHCLKCKKPCDTIEQTPTSNEWIEEEARELSECCDVMPETLSKHQRIVYNAVLDALTQQKEAIEKEVKEKERNRIYSYIEDLLIDEDQELLGKLSNIIFNKEI